MDVSTTTIKTLEGLAELIVKYDISIVILLLGLFFIALANIEKMPFLSLNNNPTIKYSNYVIGALLLAIAIITYGAKQSPPSPPTIVSTTSPTIASTPSPTVASTTIPTVTSIPSQAISQTLPISPPKVVNSVPVISNPEAVKLVNSYLGAKRLMLSRAYKKEEAKKYLTGSLYREIAECEDCRTSMIWLERNSAYYIYGEHKLGNIRDIVIVDNQPTITMRVSGSYKYYEKSTEKSQKNYCGDFIYTFALDEGVWKISDSLEKSSCT